MVPKKTEEREKVLVPVRRRDAETRKEMPAQPGAPEPPAEYTPEEMPRRWRIY